VGTHRCKRCSNDGENALDSFLQRCGIRAALSDQPRRQRVAPQRNGVAQGAKQAPNVASADGHRRTFMRDDSAHRRRVIRGLRHFRGTRSTGTAIGREHSSKMMMTNRAPHLATVAAR
jgi:hypothetical protein